MGSYTQPPPVGSVSRGLGELGEERRGEGQRHRSRDAIPVREYYDRRAPEYDDWYVGTGLFAARDRPGWDAEVEALTGALAALPPARTLDVACGTGFLTRHLRGELWGLDRSRPMLAVARERLPAGRVVEGERARPAVPRRRVRARGGRALLRPPRAGGPRPLPGRGGARAPELLVVDSARRPDVPEERWDPRVLSDGSRHAVFKRWFTPAGLAAELGGGEVVHAGDWFVAVLRA